VSTSPAAVRYGQIASHILLALALLFILHWHLLVALLAGLTAYQLIQLLAHGLPARFSRHAKLIATIALGVLVAAVLTPLLMALGGWLARFSEHWPQIAQRLDGLLLLARAQLPDSWLGWLPDNVDQMHHAVLAWLQGHIATVRVAGTAAVTAVVHAIVGMVLGLLVAIEGVRAHDNNRPLALALSQRVHTLANAFRQVVFAQIRIALLNTALTAVFLLLVLPLLGHPLPFTKTLIVLTLVFGLLPVIGNLLSNIAIVVVALAVALEAGVAALIFLVLIHKLEYFLNARIVGNHIHARAWEILLAMVLLEAAFGLAGVVAAPVFYAYLKAELVSAELV